VFDVCVLCGDKFMNKAPRSIVATLVAFSAVVIMFTLGFWQLERAAEKTQRLEQIHSVSSLAAIDLMQAAGLGTTALDMPVQFTGTIDSKHVFFIDNRIYQGRVGYELVAPVITAEGGVMVNFGWLAAPKVRTELPDFVLSTQEQAFQGVVSIPQLNKMITETASVDGQWPKVLQQANLQEFSRHYLSPIYPFMVLLDAEANSQFERHWQPVVMAPERHIAYAIQWFALAGAAVLIYLRVARKKRAV
jgi:surfeit locus 1 family protein